ncbi:MAG TPA: sialidase family protein, partial [Vicinamibacteria bacterium]
MSRGGALLRAAFGAACVLLAVGALASCAKRSLPGVVVEEIPNPAAPGSGEASLASLPDGRAVLSWIERAGEESAVRMAVRDRSAWGEPRTIARGPDFFVNWADFPTVAALGDGTLFAHWLEKNTPGKYSYVVKLARSRDLGRSWSEPLVPHADTSAVEHGFVSMADDGAGQMALVWLDGRDPGGTALLATRAGAEGPVVTEERVDGRVCDCCQTALIRTSRGLLAAFRDRSEGEVRDIAISRFEGGAWSPAQVVASDGWRIDGCPVNGPALAVEQDRVALAWFTAEPAPRVLVAFSRDGGRQWGAPQALHEGRPLGRVDVAFLPSPNGDAVVSFLEQEKPAAEQAGGEPAAGPARVVLRRVDAGGRVSAPV